MVDPYGPITAYPFHDAGLILGSGADLIDRVRLGCELKRFGKAWAPGINIPLFLEGFRKKGSQEDLSQYSVRANARLDGGEPFWTGAVSGIVDQGFFPCTTEIYRDVPYHFILSKKERKIATIGFEAKFGGILVSQLQGIKGNKENLRPLKWPKALLAMLEMWAGENKVPKVMVLPHSRNKYAGVSGDSNQGRLIYDVTAKRSGYVFDDLGEVYVKPLRGEVAA